MKTLTTFLALILLVSISSAVPADTETELRAAFDYLEQVWKEGDLDAIRGHYHSDFVSFSDDAELNLKQRVEDFEIIMEEGKDRGVLEFSNIQIRPLDEDLALAWGRTQLRFKDGTELNSRFSSVYRKTPFGWRVIFTHN